MYGPKSLISFKRQATSANIVVVPCKRTQHVGPIKVACWCLTMLRPFAWAFTRSVSKDNGGKTASWLHSHVKLLYSVIKSIVLYRSLRGLRRRCVSSLLYRMIFDIPSEVPSFTVS